MGMCAQRCPTGLYVSVLAGVMLAAQTALPAEPEEAPGASTASIVIYRNSQRYTTFPDVKRLPDGRLLCVFRDASFPQQVRHIEADARIVGALSRDAGRHWTAPFVIYDHPSCQNDPSVAVLRDGRLLLTFFNWDGLSADHVARHKPPFARKVDRGAWGAYAQPGGVHLLAGKSKPVVWDKRALHVGGTATRLLATSSSILETRSGALLLPVYGRTPERPVDRAGVFRSTDSGKTWGRQIPIAVDPAGKIAMQEPALAETGKGRIVALLRTAKAGDHLYMTRSADDGISWSAPVQTPLIGHPADLAVLPNGKLLAVYGYRHKPFGVRACVSRDGGRTWNREDEIVIAAEGAHTDLGYPSACLTADGHVFIAYYMNGPDTRDRWIEGKRIPLFRFR